MTTTDLAKLLDIEISVMKGIEAGIIRPSLDNLIKMCKILNASADTLILNETRYPLSLEGLSSEEIKFIRYVYTKLKELKEDK